MPKIYSSAERGLRACRYAFRADESEGRRAWQPGAEAADAAIPSVETFSNE
jgi:hypothetical protein